MTGLARDAAMAATTVRLAAAGDAVAFARIVADYHADMIRVAYVVSGGDQDLADDAVQAGLPKPRPTGRGFAARRRDG